MKKPIIVAASCIALTLCLTGCACEHENVIEATCTEDSVCEDCGEIVQEAAGHTPDASWTVIDFENALIEEHTQCTVCEEYITINSEKANSYVKDGKFLFGFREFAKGFDDASSGVSGYTFNSEEDYSTSAGFYSDDNYAYYKIEHEEDNDATVGMYSFTCANGETLLARGGDDIKTINILIDGSEYVSPIVWTAVMTVDPALDYSDSMEVGQSIVDNVGNMDGVTSNSINYVLYKEDAYHYLVITAI